MSILGRTIFLSRAGGANQVTLIRGKPAPHGLVGSGSWVVGDPSRPKTNKIAVDLVDLEGNENALIDIQKAWGASQLGITDGSGNALTPTQLIGLFETQMMPPIIGPFQSPGTVTLNQFLAGAAADGIKAQEPFTMLEAEATAQVANTVGSNVLTVTNITTSLACTFTFTAGAALFKRATASSQLLIRKGDKYKIQWTAVGGTPGSDVSVLLKTLEGS